MLILHARLGTELSRERLLTPAFPLDEHTSLSQVPASALAGKNSGPLFSCSPGGRFVGCRDVHSVRLSQEKGFSQDFVCTLRRGEGGFKKQRKQPQSRNYTVGTVAVSPDFGLDSGTSQLV